MINWIRQKYENFEIARTNAGLTRKIFPNHHYVIEKAFEISGRTYYQFSNIADMPAGRGLYLGGFWAENEIKCDRDYLLRHCEVMDDILSNKEISIFNIKTLNDQLRDRLNSNFDVDILYKLASVAYFDKNEDPISYDPEYNRKKIEFWRKNKPVGVFFSQEPLLKYLDFLQQYEPYLQTYLQISQEVNQIHFQRLELLSSKNTLTTQKSGKKASEKADKK